MSNPAAAAERERATPLTELPPSHPHHSRSRLIAAFAAVYIVWGSTYLAIRYSVETIPPFLMGGSRFVVSGAILVAWAALRGESLPSARQWRDASITGVLMLCGGNGAVAWAEQRVPSGIAALLVAVVPLWMVLIDWLRPHGARPRLSAIIGIIIGLGGLALLVGPDALSGHSDIDISGAVILIAGSLSWAAGSIHSRYTSHAQSAVMSTGMQMLGGSAGLLLLSLLLGEVQDFDVASVSRASTLGWLYLVTFGSLVGFTAYIYLLKVTTPAKAATYAYVNPLVAVFLGWAIAGEPITTRTLVAAAVILGGVAMITLGQAAEMRD
jgi:drug/metabolite transporter (DMT)-like permease